MKRTLLTLIAGSLLIVSAATAQDKDNDLSAVAYGTVNVRSGPGMNYPIIGQLDTEDTLPVLGRSGDDNDWLYIQQDDTQGWVAFFTVTVRGKTDSLPVFTVGGSGDTTVPENNVIRTRFNVRLRKAPSIAESVLEVVPFRSVVTPLARTDSGDWLYVLYKQTSGWGVADLFDISDELLDALPVYNAAVHTPTPTTPAGGR
jgi:N-acetylmuramoyl-L-alanine amidase